MNKFVIAGEAVAGLALLVVTAAGAMPHVALATVATLVGTGLLVDAFQHVRTAQRAKQS